MKFTILLLLAATIFGCQNSEMCLRVEGDVSKIGIENGAVEFCLNRPKSEALSAPVFESGTDEYIMLSREQIERANAAMTDEDDSPKKMLVPSETPIRRFLRLIRRR